MMNELTETRQEIEKGIKLRHRENEDRARHMGLIVDDQEVVDHTKREVSLSATSEGAKEVKKVFTTAAMEIRKEFEKQNKDLQIKINKCKQAENKLGNKEKTAKQDAVKIERGATQIKEHKKARHLALAAEHTMIGDAKFLEKEKVLQKRLRQYTEKKREQQKKRLLNSKLKW